MRYIRFLKTPRIAHEKNSSKPSISCLITITSDLGDSFLPYDVTLYAELWSETSVEVLVSRPIEWTAGMRSLPISLPLSNSWGSDTVKVRVGVAHRSLSDDFSTLSEGEARGVVSAWSAPLDSVKGTEKLIERRFSSSKQKEIRIWEETGESIARHLWDAGITLSSNLIEPENVVDICNRPLAEALCMPEDKERLQVLELGTGCGMVGITVAQGVGQVDVVLTDLPEAEEIVQKNISQAKLAEKSSIIFQTLDWEEELPALNKGLECPHCAQFDLIIAADCTYNPDSSPALVKTMSRLAHASPEVTIVVAMKMRHSSEEIFFTLMSEAGFATAKTIQFPLPGDETVGEETVFVHFYRYEAAERGIKVSPNESCLSRIE